MLRRLPDASDRKEDEMAERTVTLKLSLDEESVLAGLLGAVCNNIHESSDAGEVFRRYIRPKDEAALAQINAALNADRY